MKQMKFLVTFYKTPSYEKEKEKEVKQKSCQST